jgi:hypothetical protein
MFCIFKITIGVASSYYWDHIFLKLINIGFWCKGSSNSSYQYICAINSLKYNWDIFGLQCNIHCTNLNMRFTSHYINSSLNFLFQLYGGYKKINDTYVSIVSIVAWFQICINSNKSFLIRINTSRWDISCPVWRSKIWKCLSKDTVPI